ncbi:MAG: tetratricopeptide repeat protein [Bdellovibrionota bacterium]
MRPNLAVLLTAAFYLGGCSSLSSPSQKRIDSANNFFGMGLGFFDDGSYPESLQAFEQASALIPNNPDFEMHRALALYYVDRHEQSLDLLRKTCLLREEFPDCHNNLAVLLLKSGKSAEALKHAEKALSAATYSTPNFAKTNKGLALHALGRDREAIETFTTIQDDSSSPLHCRNELYLSRSYLSLANFSQASRHARIGRDVCLNEETALLWQAYVQYRTGQIVEAKDLYLEALRTFHNPELRDEARVSLNQLNREEVLAEPKLFL